jgi:hypothetical protein
MISLITLVVVVVVVVVVVMMLCIVGIYPPKDDLVHRNV